MGQQSRARTIPDFFFQAAERHGKLLALHAPRQNPEGKLTYTEVAEKVRDVGGGLIAAGLQAGEKIAHFSDNQPRWIIADLAALCIGSVDVPRGSDTADGEFRFILEHSEAAAAFVETEKLYRRLAAAGALQNLRFVVTLDDSSPQGEGGPGKVYRFSELEELGRDQRAEFEKRRSAVMPDTLATIVYTSGTTGSPKGVMLTHGNLAHQPEAVELGLDMQPGEIQIAILPSWHAYERATEYYGLKHGHTLTYSDKRYLKKDLEALRPQLMPCVPRIWESVYDAVHDKVRKSKPIQQKLFHFFTAVGLRYVRARRVATGSDLRKERAGMFERLVAMVKAAALWPLHVVGDRLIFSKLRNVTGGRMRGAVSGGGSLAAYLDDFFDMVGITIMNGYGLTETAPVLTNRRADRNVRGSVGRPMAETEIEIRDEQGQRLSQGQQGVIFARGPQVMQGYYKNPEATAKVLDAAGWFNTGDLGYIAVTGDLVITGRAKDTIVLASGENVEPEPIEDAIRKSPLVNQVMLVGQDEKFVGALVVPNFAPLAQAMGLPEEMEPEQLVADPAASRIVQDSIKKVMAAEGTFKGSDQIQKVLLLAEPFSEQNGMMTQTMKVKRNVVAKHFESVIREMFA